MLPTYPWEFKIIRPTHLPLHGLPAADSCRTADCSPVQPTHLHKFHNTQTSKEKQQHSRCCFFVWKFEYAYNMRMNTKRFAVAALFIGTIGIAFEILQIVFYETHLSMEWSYPGSGWNYLAFFTVITNLLIDVWFLLLAFAIFFKRKKLYAFLTRPEIQGALVVYIATVSIVYCALLFWFIGPYSLTLWWANIIDMWNHLILPIIVIALWFAVPREKPIKWSVLFYWLIIPCLYLVLSLIRGIIWDWYPYPFLRPSWLLFPIGTLFATACFVGFGALVIWLNNRKLKF